MKSRFRFIVALLMAVCFTASVTAFAAVPTVKLPQATNAPSLLSTRSVVMSDLPQMTAAQSAHSVSQEFAPRTPGFTAAQLAAMRQQILSRAPSGLAAGTAGPRAGFTPVASKNFLGIDVNCSFVTPSDMGIAAGGTHVVQAANECLQINTKAGGLVSRVSFNTFTGCPASTCSLFDPRLTFDPVKKRYVLVIDNRFSNGTSSIFIAVTATSNPTGSWFIFDFGFPGAAGDFADYPTLGIDRNGFYIGINDFEANGAFTNQLWLVNKAQAYVGSVPTVRVFSGFSVCTSTCAPVDTLQPANVSSPTDQPRTEFVVNSINGSVAGLLGCNTCNGMVIWGVTDPFGSVTLSGVIVGTPVNYTFSTGANEPGAAGAIETIDLRFSGNVQYQGGFLYPTLCSNLSGPENTTITFQVRPAVNSATRALVSGASFGQTLIYGDGGLLRTNGSAFFGTVQPNSDGDLLMVFAFSSDTDFPGVAYITHRTSELDGAWNYGGGGFFLRSGLVFYNEGRWGDYSGTAPEYTASQINFWFSGMFSQSFSSIANSWATAIGKDAYTSFTQN